MPIKQIRREKSSGIGNRPLKESWVQFFIVPGLWIIAAIVPLIIFVKTHDPRLIRTLLLMSGGIAGALITALFILYSPVVRSLKLRAKELQAFCTAIQKAASKIEAQELLQELGVL